MGTLACPLDGIGERLGLLGKPAATVYAYLHRLVESPWVAGSKLSESLAGLPHGQFSKKGLGSPIT